MTANSSTERRVTVADLAAAADQLNRSADGMDESDDDSYESLRKVAEWLDRECDRRYRAMGKRTLPVLLGFVSGGTP